MPAGILQIRVYTSDAQLPVQNATVIVYSTNTPRRLLSSLHVHILKIRSVFP